MKGTVEAVFQDGVFRPVQRPNLPESKRVRLTVDSVREASSGDVLRLATTAALGVDRLDAGGFQRLDDPTQLAYDELKAVEFIEAPAFTQLLPEYLTDDEYRDLQRYLANNPKAGDVIQGTGGFRKLRWADPRRGQGKRGGARVVYYYFDQDQGIWFLTMYGKNEVVDLSAKEKRLLKTAVDEEKRQRAQRRTSRRK